MHRNATPANAGDARPHGVGASGARETSSRRMAVMTIVLLALAVIAAVHVFFPGRWGAVYTRSAELMTAGFAWLDSLGSVPLWSLFVIMGAAIFAVHAVAARARARGRTVSSDLTAITTAEVFGIKWRWKNHEGAIRDLASFCLKCDRPVQPASETRHGFLRLISYSCECGAWRSQSFQCSEVEFMKRVHRNLRQAIDQSAAPPPR
jgi:hypothetical protein